MSANIWESREPPEPPPPVIFRSSFQCRCLRRWAQGDRRGMSWFFRGVISVIFFLVGDFDVVNIKDGITGCGSKITIIP